MKSIFSRSVSVLFVLLFLAAIPFSAMAVDGKDYAALFQQAADDLTETAPALSEAFQNDPIAFIQALALEDMTLQDAVGDTIAECCTENGNELEFLQFVLEVYVFDDFTASERNALLFILMSFHADVTNADDEFLNALLQALPHADGAGADKCGIYLYDLFLSDPVRVLGQMAVQDADFQEQLVLTLNYQRSGLSSETQYIETVRNLSKNQALTEAEQAFVAKLADKLIPVEPETAAPVETSLPLETIIPAQTAVPAVSTDSPETQNNAVIITIECIAMAAVVIVAIIQKKSKNSSK